MNIENCLSQNKARKVKWSNKGIVETSNNMLDLRGSDGKASACSAGDPGSISGSGRSPGEGNGNPPQYSCLENSMDRGTWWATVHGITKHRT